MSDAKKNSYSFVTYDGTLHYVTRLFTNAFFNACMAPQLEFIAERNEARIWRVLKGNNSFQKKKYIKVGRSQVIKKG